MNTAAGSICLAACVLCPAQPHKYAARRTVFPHLRKLLQLLTLQCKNIFTPPNIFTPMSCCQLTEELFTYFHFSSVALDSLDTKLCWFGQFQPSVTQVGHKTDPP